MQGAGKEKRRTSTVLANARRRGHRGGESISTLTGEETDTVLAATGGGEDTVYLVTGDDRNTNTDH